MQFEFFDSHSHINSPVFDEYRQDIIKRMEEKSIGTICVGVDKETSKQVIDIAKLNKNIFACIGQHPVDSLEDFDYDFYREIAKEKKVVAIGECGLDYFRVVDHQEKSRQKEIFIKHIELALEINKPLMLHIRPSKNSMDAYTDALDILERYKKEYREKLKGNSHFFAGNMDIAKRFLEIDFMLSFTGVITFARDYDEVIKYTPIDMLLVETDSPFVSPVPFRGKVNDPINIVEILKKIADIRGEHIDKIIPEIIKNNIRLFNI